MILLNMIYLMMNNILQMIMNTHMIIIHIDIYIIIDKHQKLSIFIIININYMIHQMMNMMSLNYILLIKNKTNLI